MAHDVFLKLEYGPRDVVNVLRARAMGSAAGRAAAWTALACLACAPLLWIYGPRWVKVLAGWGLAIAVVQSVFAAVRMWPHALFRRSAADERLTPEIRDDFWNRQMSVDASEDGVTVTLGRRSATLRWRDCVRLVSDPRVHLLLHGESGYLAIPRRAFRNPRRDAAFSELVAELLVRAPEGTPAPAPPAVPAPDPVAAEQPVAPPAHAEPAPARAAARAARNDPCPCGSGKKYKKCCLDADSRAGGRS